MGSLRRLCVTLSPGDADWWLALLAADMETLFLWHPILWVAALFLLRSFGGLLVQPDL